MDFQEFLNLCACLMGETPLGNVVAIRSETDPKRIKEFSKEQQKIRRDWLHRNAKEQKNDSVSHAGSMDALFAMAKA